MDFELTADQELARRTAREFAEAEIAPVIGRFDEAEEFPAELIGKLGALGFLGALFPPEYGGGGRVFAADALAGGRGPPAAARLGDSLRGADTPVSHHGPPPRRPRRARQPR